MNIEPLWELYRKLTREAFEHQKKYDREKKEGSEYASLTYIEMDEIRARSTGVMQSIVALADDKKEAWRRGFEIWQEENELAPEGKFGCWMPTEKKTFPERAGHYLVSAKHKYGKTFVFEAHICCNRNKDMLYKWYTCDEWYSAEKNEVSDDFTITAWMPMPEPYCGGDDEGEIDEQNED